MTTPERLRRRQRIEGVFLIIVGLAVVVSSLYFRHQDQQQRSCLTSTVGGIVDALNARGEIATRQAQVAKRESNVARLESNATRRLFREGFAAEDQAALFAAYGQYRITLSVVDAKRERIDEKRAQIEEDRAKNPYPDFPAGTCE